MQLVANEMHASGASELRHGLPSDGVVPRWVDLPATSCSLRDGANEVLASSFDGVHGFSSGYNIGGLLSTRVLPRRDDLPAASGPGRTLQTHILLR